MNGKPTAWAYREIAMLFWKQANTHLDYSKKAIEIAVDIAAARADRERLDKLGKTKKSGLGVRLP